VRLVITDTTPLNYLILIGHIEVLSLLFDKVIVPSTVRDELCHPKAPPASGNGFLNHQLGRKCAPHPAIATPL
jgi:hypothetical protein